MSTAPSLLPHHQRLIAASAISPTIAADRGYRSICTKAEAAELGFPPYQCRVPGLVHPIWTVHGRIESYQLRPDYARVRNGKPIKYETLAGSPMFIDVPPVVRPSLADPHVPLFITEGVRKADSAASRGLACIDLIGVWNWRGKNHLGGKTVLADWESIALNGRKVVIVFDSDVMTKAPVLAALVRLRAFLERRGADVFVANLERAR